MSKISKVAVLTLACFSLVLGLSPTAMAVPTLIEDYSIYGEHGVFLGAGSDVYGLVGASNGTLNAGWAIKLNGQGTTIYGDARSGANVNLQNNANILGTLYLTTTALLTTGSLDTISAIVRGDPELPVFPAATDISSQCASNAPNFTGTIGTVTVGPGVYGKVQYSGKVTLDLEASGDYYFKSISGGGGSQIIVEQPGIRVFVCGGVKFAGTGGVKVSPDSLDNCEFSVEVQTNDWHNAFEVAGGTKWIGNVFAPNGGIHIGNNATVRGQLVGQFVDLEHSTLITNEVCKVCNICACIDTFAPAFGAAGSAVTLNGKGLDNVAHVVFSTTCGGAGVEGTITALSQTAIIVTAPAGLAAGNYHIIVNSCNGTFCTEETFKVQ